MLLASALCLVRFISLSLTQNFSNKWKIWLGSPLLLYVNIAGKRKIEMKYIYQRETSQQNSFRSKIHDKQNFIWEHVQKYAHWRKACASRYFSWKEMLCVKIIKHGKRCNKLSIFFSGLNFFLRKKIAEKPKRVQFQAMSRSREKTTSTMLWVMHIYVMTTSWRFITWFSRPMAVCLYLPYLAPTDCSLSTLSYQCSDQRLKTQIHSFSWTQPAFWHSPFKHQR